jgi:sugar phosphate isomerase/epimerase
MLPDLTPEEAVHELATIGYDGIEWRMTHVPPERRHQPPSFWGNHLCTLEPTEADALRGRTLAQSAGLAVPNLGTYIGVSDGSAALTASLTRTEEAMRLAQIAGSPCIRVSSGDMRGSYRAQFAATQAYLAEVEKLSRRYGIKALIEIHLRTICPSASLTHRLVSPFDPACIGVIHDAGNMVYEGFEDYRIGLELLGPYLAHVHIKNAAFTRPEGGGVWTPRAAPLEDGVVNFEALLTAFRDVGYDGWLSFEDFSLARPSREALRFNKAFIEGVLARIS